MIQAAESGIVPRWEWRTFGERFVDAERRFAARDPDGVTETVDLHLVSRNGDNSVKVRDGLMDVKHLECVDDDGLEQWLPVMKEPFPIAAGDVKRVLTDLRVTAGRHAPHRVHAR